ncbi:FAD-binding oxidoreductase [Pseudorhodoferax sp.]|uniref:FAD-binding oxidoreductase n=1 Tax=Pseudorhodoferax sp. TaxID=1993553 RepID=UPI002DD61BC9|nr:FAD-linked oxidase C-terminal domain-containing protein [Pseudorhodoferax sp.]
MSEAAVTMHTAPSPRPATRRSPPAALLAALHELLGQRLTQSAAECLQHGSDESHFAPQPPDAVAYAESTEEVARIVGLCHAHATPVIAFGVGSSVEGHILAVQGGICLDLSRMSAVLAIEPDNLTATAQAGVTRLALNAALAGTGLFFSVDPGADASLGGMVATAASGTNTVRYGTMRENTVSLTVVTAEGKVIRTASHARKSSAGYNLTQLFAGSEGTLGIVTEVTVRLHPQPECVAAAVVNFPDLHAAVRSVIQAIQMGVPLARAELLDALSIRAINAHSKTCHKEAPTVFFEFCGGRSQVDEQAATVAEIAGEYGGGGFAWSTLPEERSRLWQPRHHAYFAALQLKPGCRSSTTDACVPLARLGDCMAETLDDIATLGLPVPVLGHVGDGNFHCLVLMDPGRPEEVAQAEAFSARMAARAIRFGGTCTGEHGVGLHKKAYLLQEHGEDAVELMARIKRALDPRDILNPGKVVPVPRGAERVV